MKRLIMLITLGAMLVTALLLSSCKTETVYDKVSKAIDSTISLYQFEVSVVEDISASTVDLERTFTSEFNLKVREINSHFKEHSSELYIHQPDFSAKVDIYAKNNVFYIDIGGKKIKETSSEKTIGYNMENIYRKLLRPLPEELFEDTEIVDDQLELSLTSEQFLEIFGEYINYSIQSFESNTSKNNLSAEEGKVTLTLKDGYISSYFISCKLILDVEYLNQTVQCTIDINSRVYVNDVGNDVEIKPPVNLDSYVAE